MLEKVQFGAVLVPVRVSTGTSPGRGGTDALRVEPCQYQATKHFELFPPGQGVDLAVPPYRTNVFGALVHFRAVPGWRQRYGSGSEFRPMFIGSGTAARPQTNAFSAMLVGS